MSYVEVGETTYPVDRASAGRKGREGSEGQNHKEEEREGESGTGEGAQEPIDEEGWLYWIFV